MCQNALKNAKLKNILKETFRGIISKGWIVPTDVILFDTKCGYLPFFVTKQDKARVVFNGATTFKGAALNDAVCSEINLLNDLVKALIRFQVGRYTYMTDLSKSFFQAAMPES